MFKIKSKFLIIFLLSLILTFSGPQVILGISFGDVLAQANTFIMQINEKLDMALNIETQIMTKVNDALDMSNITNLVDSQLGLLGSQNKYAKMALEKMDGKFDINALLQDKLPPSLKESIIEKIGLRGLFEQLEPIKEQIQVIKDKIAIIQEKLNKVNVFYNKLLGAVDEINGFFGQMGSKKGLFGVLKKFTRLPVIKQFFKFVEKLKKKKLPNPFCFPPFSKKINLWEAIKTTAELASWVVSIYTAGGVDVFAAAIGAVAEGFINAILETLMEKIQETVWATASKLLEGNLDDKMDNFEKLGSDIFSSLRDAMKEVFKDPIDWDALLTNLPNSLFG